MNFDTEKFIVEIKNRPCLWNTALKDYSDRNLKIKCRDEIVHIFKEKDDMTNEEKKQLGDALQKKWKSIRGCFIREISRQKTLKSGSGSGSRKSEYVFFQQLQFLRNIVAIREPDPVAVTAEPADENSQQDRSVQKGPKKSETKENTVSEDDKFIEALNKSIKSREKYETNNQDEDRLFMLSLVNTLKRVHPQRKMATKIKIMSILDEATRIVPYNIGNPGSSFWSQQPEMSFQNSHPGYSTRREGPEILPMDHNADPPSHRPPSNMTNHSEESSILDLYDY